MPGAAGFQRHWDRLASTPWIRDRCHVSARPSTRAEQPDTRQNGSPDPLSRTSPHPRVHRPCSVHCAHCTRVAHRRHHPRPADPNHQSMLPPDPPALQSPVFAVLAPHASEEEGGVEHHCECIRFLRALRAARVLHRRACRADDRRISSGAASAGLAKGRRGCAGQPGAEQGRREEEGRLSAPWPDDEQRGVGVLDRTGAVLAL
jgi:hypothetical protein